MLFCGILQTIWPGALGLGLGLLVVVIWGVFAARHRRRPEPRAKGASVTEWGQNLALVYELRREIKRLGEENQRLSEERGELVKMLARVVELLQQTGGQISGKAPSSRRLG